MFIETFALSIWVTTLTSKVTVTNAVFVSLLVSTFCQPCFNTETFTLVSYPGTADHPKPIEFEVDQSMVIRLISLMSKLLNGPIS